MREIQLTKSGRVALIDDVDYESVSRFKWSLFRPNLHLAYAQRIEKGKAILLHRVIMNAPDGVLVDHRDSNGLNNQRHNLRLCSPTQNACNKRKHIQRFSSRFKGVFWLPVYTSGTRKGRLHAKPWVAQITYQHRTISRFFKTENEAAMAYDQLARTMHGEFARPNFI